MGINDTVTPVETCLEPPRFCPMFLDRFQVRQSPVTKFRDKQRQVGASLMREVWEPYPVAAFGKFGNPFIPLVSMVRDSAVVVEILQIAGYVGIASTGRVVDNQASRVN